MLNEVAGELNAKVGINGVVHAESKSLGEAVVEDSTRPHADEVWKGEVYLEVIPGELNADLGITGVPNLDEGLSNGEMVSKVSMGGVWSQRQLLSSKVDGKGILPFVRFLGTCSLRLDSSLLDSSLLVPIPILRFFESR